MLLWNWNEEGEFLQAQENALALQHFLNADLVNTGSFERTLNKE